MVLGKPFLKISSILGLGLFICCIVTGWGLFDYPRPISSIQHFEEAKNFAKKIHYDHQRTFYCGCRFSEQGNVDLQSCGYKVQRDIRRARRLEWEHIVPASHLAFNRPCAQKRLCCNKGGKCFKGRACCRKIDPEFSQMEADLHNLVPEIGELNALRSNYRFGILPHIRPNQFGGCAVKIDEASRRIEPNLKIRGLIARAYLYMSKTYQIPLSDSQSQLFHAWNKAFPPDTWEIEWDKRVASIQGNHNQYISHYGEMKRDE